MREECGTWRLMQQVLTKPPMQEESVMKLERMTAVSDNDRSYTYGHLELPGSHRPFFVFIFFVVVFIDRILVSKIKGLTRSAKLHCK